jgi:hypothetical protein
MSPTGWGTGKPLTFFYSVGRQCATNYGHCDLVQCCCDTYLRGKKGGRYGKNVIFLHRVPMLLLSSLFSPSTQFQFPSPLRSPFPSQTFFTFSLPLPSSLFLFSASFSSSYSSISPSSIRNVLVYIPRSYLPFLAFLFFLTFIFVCFLSLFFFSALIFMRLPSLLFLLSPPLFLIASGFRSKFFLFLFLYILSSGSSVLDIIHH